MKQLFTFLFSAISIFIFAQAPQSIPYQAVVRNTDGSNMANAAVTITFKIHDNSTTGTVVYEETHATTTNAQGLVSLNVGGGNVVTGTFSGIQWGTGSKFLHVLMNAGNGVVDLGAQQMMSVPYSLFSNACNIEVSLTGDTLFTGGGDFVIIPGISTANFPNNDVVDNGGNGGQLLPGVNVCSGEYISVSSCGGQNSIFYNGQSYDLTEIGGQCWFADNLATDFYRNGDPIPNNMGSTQGASTIYDNLATNKSIYGKLYNWYAVIDPRGVCPSGWHVPSDCEFMFMENALGLSSNQLEFATWRGSIGHSLKSTNLWFLPNNATNSSGFTAVPGGYWDGGSIGLGQNCTIITSTSWDSSTAWYRMMGSGAGVARSTGGKVSGYEVRCIKD
jgi:uncharacterized protein (TIGR02145 family)